MKRSEAEKICELISKYKRTTNKFEKLKIGLEEQRDSAILPTTKALYQAILDRMEDLV